MRLLLVKESIGILQNYFKQRRIFPSVMNARKCDRKRDVPVVKRKVLLGIRRYNMSNKNSRNKLAILYEFLILLRRLYGKAFQIDISQVERKKIGRNSKSAFLVSSLLFVTDEIADEQVFFLAGDKNGSVRAWSMSLNSFPMVTQFLGKQRRSTLGGRNS